MADCFFRQLKKAACKAQPHLWHHCMGKNSMRSGGASATCPASGEFLNFHFLPRSEPDAENAAITEISRNAPLFIRLFT